jgi:excisionase family DNA binding protein
MSNLSRPSGREARLLSIGEVAEYCAVSDKTVRRWIDRKQLRAHQLGRQWRIAPEDLESFLLTRASWQRRFVS